MNFYEIILLISIVLQLSSAAFAFKLLKKISNYFSISFTLAILLMAMRRIDTLFTDFGTGRVVNMGAELIALVISALIFSGLYRLNMKYGKNFEREDFNKFEDGTQAVLPKNLTKIAITLGVLGVLSAASIGIYTYYESKTVILDSMFKNNLTLASTLREHANVSQMYNSEEDVLNNLQILWEKTNNPYEGSYLCFVDEKANLMLHTMNPNSVGNYVGDNISGDGKLIDIVNNKKDWVGYYTSSAGQSQIAAFAYTDILDGFISIHVPLSTVNSDIRSYAETWAMGISFIIFMVIPLSIGLLQIAYTRTQKKLLSTQVLYQKSEDSYKNLLNEAGDTILTTDQKGYITYVNPAAEQLTGYSSEEIIGKNFQELIKPKWRDSVSAFYRKQLKENLTETVFEFPIITKDGSEKWVEQKVNTYEKGDTEFVAQSILRDITARKSAEGKASSFSRIFDESLNEIYLFRADTLKFIQVNSTAQNNLGYTMEEFLDLTPVDIKPEFTLESFEELIAPLRSDKEKKSVIETVHKRKDNSLYDVEVHLQLMEYENEPTFVAFISDITARKQDEKEKLDLQEKLKQSERLESLGLLAGGVAHDLNNIIGPIMAYPDIIKMDLSEGNPVDEELDAISASAQRAADVVSDLLALTRSSRYEMVTIDLNGLVNDFLNSAESKSIKASYSKVKSKIRLSKDTLVIKGSKAHLPKVIMNLMNNAFESMPNGGVLKVTTSSITVEEGDIREKNVPQGRYHLLTIEDQGEGIPEENISKIFDPFYTSKIKSVKSGTGLGLSIVYNVLKDHNALIDVESKLGKGTKFSIYFPETSDLEVVSPKADLKETAKGSILVVDDLKEQREIATRLLTSLGYEVESVEKGKDAINYIKKNNVDILILDMILDDDVDGLDIYREIIKFKPNQKTLIVSGFSESNRVKEAEDLGANGFIQKPYTLDEIGQKIELVMLG